MIITDRDRKLLELLNRYLILSTKQVKELCFSGTSKTTMHRRLRVLEENSLIRSVLGHESGQSVWGLTREGGSLVGAKFPAKGFNRNSLEHDVSLTELRLCLEKHGSGNNWTSEWEIKCQSFNPKSRSTEAKKIIPDGVFVILEGEKPLVFAVEMEFTLKHFKRYREIFKSYADNSGLQFVWYVVPTEAVGHTLLEQWNRNVKSSYRHFGYSVLSSILDDFWNAKMVFDKKEHFIYQVLRLKKPAHLGAHTPAHSVSGGPPKNEAAGTNPTAQSDSEIQNSNQKGGMPSVADHSHPTSWLKVVGDDGQKKVKEEDQKQTKTEGDDAA